MDFAFTLEQEQLRQDVRQFLIEELGTAHIRIFAPPIASKEFSQKMAKRGWIGMTWPKEYGGGGRSYIDRMVMMEELCRFGAPYGFHGAADAQAGPSLIRFGSEELKREFLPKIIAGEVMFAALISERAAGSDLSAMECGAVEDGDDFVINGHKLWSTNTRQCTHGWLLAVTDPEGRKYKNASEFIIDMRKPGVTIRPIVDPAGRNQLDEVILDDYRVPRRYLVGKKNEGFYQSASQVEFVRAGIDRVMMNYPVLEAIVRYVKEAGARGKPPKNLGLLRDQIADLKARFEAARLLAYRAAWMLSQGRLPNAESAMAKAYGNDFQQRLATVAVDILGLSGLLRPGSPCAPYEGVAALSYMESPGWSLMSGTREILHNIVAQRGLGLPAQ